MATKEREYWNERIVQKNNTGTYWVSIPLDMVRDLRLKQGQRVVFSQKGKTLIIKDAPKR